MVWRTEDADGGDAPVGRLRVLVVDDSPYVRELVAELVLDAGGAVVGEAADGQQAVAAALELRPDLIVMDWRMPVMDGVEATAAITAQLAGVEVVVYSSGDEAEIANAFAGTGAVAYIDKTDALKLIGELRARAARAARAGA